MAKRKKTKMFRQLQESLKDALAYERGERVDLRVTEIPPPPKLMSPEEIARIRQELNASQTLFAMLLNVSPKAVQSWEQGLRHPTRAALRLLAIAKKNPKLLLRA